jgi:hypothetical protein
MSKAFYELAIPVKPIKCDSGYFLIIDVSACRDSIPEKYLRSHDYDADEP